MSITKPISYRLSDKLSTTESIEVAIERVDDSNSIRHTYFQISYHLPTHTQVDESLFFCGSTALGLKAHVPLSKSNEIWVESIEAGALMRGQSFAKKTFSQLLEFTPEATSLVLYNVTHRKAAEAIELGRNKPNWDIIPNCALLQALQDCGFQTIVGFQLIGPAYLAARASNRK